MNYKRLASLAILPAYYLLLVWFSAAVLPDDVAGNIWISGAFAITIPPIILMVLAFVGWGTWTLWEWLHER